MPPVQVTALLAMLALPGCTRGSDAVGALLFTPESVFAGDAQQKTDAVATAFFATQAELIASTGLLQRVVEETRLDGGVDGLRRSLRVQRRGDSLVLEVRTTGPDGPTAAMRCNLVLRNYLDQRLQSQRAPHLAKAQWLAQKLEQGSEDVMQTDALKYELRKEELAAQTLVTDARVLQPCTPAPRGF